MDRSAGMAQTEQRGGLKRAEGETVVDGLRRILSDEIVTGILGPGMRLDEQGLADRFAVSRTPIRETLSQLSALGLVEKRPPKGVVVLMQSQERLGQLFEVMAELESACARFAAERMAARERRALRRLHDTALALVQGGDLAGYAEHNTEFHQAVYAGTHNEALVETTFEARRRVFHFRRRAVPARQPGAAVARGAWRDRRCRRALATARLPTRR